MLPLKSLLKPLVLAGGLLLTSQGFSEEGCVVFKHANFKGGKLVMASKHQYVQFDGSMNDSFSSLIVGDMCHFYAYEDTWFMGLIKAYPTGRYSQLVPNDVISSGQCFCDYISE